MMTELEELLQQTNIQDIDILQSSEDSKAKKLLTLLDDIQGNILRNHGRNLAVHLFLEFKSENIDKAKKWISDFAENFVTSATQQWEQSKNRNLSASQNREPETALVSDTLFANFYLSFEGYKTLLNAEDTELKQYFSSPFKYGMKNENGRRFIRDPHPDQWEKGFGQKNIHALIILAQDRCQELINQAQKVEAEVKEFADIVHTEVGKVFRNKNGNAIEHFGFVDGISQPLFFQKDLDKITDGTDKWDPSAPLNLVLVKDPLNHNRYSCGSYLVYRKLRQNLNTFKQKIADLAKLLEVEPSLAEAFVMGRFKDGTPVTLYKESQANSANPIFNNFDYQNDTHGTKCPFHAHIRKTNPRGDLEVTDEAEQREKRIVRRGVSYSYPKDAQWSIENQLPYLETATIETTEQNNIGLLFICFQSSINNQFITLQKNWGNNVDFPRNYTGSDPLIGQAQQLDGGQYWPKGKDGWDENHKGRYDFSNCVQMKGGEYFFAPSISFLKDLPNFELIS